MNSCSSCRGKGFVETCGSCKGNGKRPAVPLERSSLMRGAALVGKTYPTIREELPSSAGIMVMFLVRGYFADDPPRAEDHLCAIESLLSIRKRSRRGQPMYDPKTGAPTAVGARSHSSRLRAAAKEVWMYLEQQGIVEEPCRGSGS